MKKQLGKVSGVRLGMEDHGIFTCDITIDFGGTGQGFGGYRLDTYNKVTKKCEGSAAGLDWIMRLMACFGVSNFDHIEGRTVYAIRKEEYGNIVGLETPSFDPGTPFLIADWQERWNIKEGG